jgi:hypothetical protein
MQDFRVIDPVVKSHLVKFDGASYGGKVRAGSIIDRSPNRRANSCQANIALAGPSGVNLNWGGSLKLL